MKSNLFLTAISRKMSECGLGGFPHEHLACPYNQATQSEVLQYFRTRKTFGGVYHLETHAVDNYYWKLILPSSRFNEVTVSS